MWANQDATLERERGRGQGYDPNDSMGVMAGQDADPYAGETDKERRKREKEEDKRRKKEAEEEKKRKKGKKGRDDLNTSEDRLDNMVGTFVGVVDDWICFLGYGKISRGRRWALKSHVNIFSVVESQDMFVGSICFAVFIHVQYGA